MVGRRSALVLLVSFVSAPQLAFSGVSEQAGADPLQTIDTVQAAYVERGPIDIFHPWEFTAENGVVAGTGTADDPYIISGWKIEPAEPATAISVAVRAGIHVRISDNWVKPIGGGTGISIGGSGTTVITNNTVFADVKGVEVGSGISTVAYNSIFNGWQGVLVLSGEVVIEKNHFQDQSIGAVSYTMDGVTNLASANALIVRQNNFMQSDVWGVQVQYAWTDEVNLADAQDNYWGNPLGPRVRVHSPCCVGPPDVRDPRPEGGAYASVGVQPFPFASQPFHNAGANGGESQ